MKIIKTKIDGLIIIVPNVLTDERGSFFESWNQKEFKKNGLNFEFLQDNQSISKKGVLRGLHFQNPPFAQGKLVRVIKGSVIDVAVDIRRNSSTYGEHLSIILSEENKKIFWIPPGFAHGFLSLKDDTILHYKCTNIYNQSSEDCLLWDDPDLNIDWKIKNPIVSKKDLYGNKFKNLTTKF